MDEMPKPTINYIANFRSLFAKDDFAQIPLQKINFKILNIRAQNDIVSLKKHYKEISANYKDKCLSTIIPNTGHAVINEKTKDVDEILKAIEKKYKNNPINTIDGVKIEFENEWVHLRKSNTEPIIRIYSESETLATAEHLANKIITDIKELITHHTED